MIAIVLATVFSVGVEAVHEKTAYHFDNPSSWDTPFLVPHFFEQRYSANKPMLVLGVRSPRWEFEAGATPVRTATGSDYDTFLQPSGDVVVHGSGNDVHMRSWRAAEHVQAGMWRAGLAYSRDQSKFPPALSTTSHTNPPSVVTSFTATRESTTSDVLDLQVGIERTTGSIWTWGVDVAPLTIARLTTNLPDKYADPVRFSARAFSAASHVAAEWRVGRGSIAVGARLGHSWRYGRRSSFTRQQAAVTVVFGMR